MTRDPTRPPSSRPFPTAHPIRAVIDRFEGEVAIVVTESESVEHVPRAKLPADAREGDVVDLRTFTLLPDERRKNEEQVKAAAAKTPSRSGNFDL